MRIARWVIATLMLCMIGVLPQNKLMNPEVLLNREGWGLPDLNEMVLEKSEKIALPAISSKITAEAWKLPEDSLYLMPFHPFRQIVPEWGDVSEKVSSLIIYKSPTNKILCYEYTRYLIRRGSRLILGETASYICDLDGDGVLETQFDATSEGKGRRLLVSILRIKLGPSDEADLVRRIISSALLEIGK